MNENQLNSYLEKGAKVGISILDEQGEDVSNHFAKITLLDNPPEFIEKVETPVLTQSHAWYATTVVELIPAGDHVLVLCRIEALEANLDANPLIYYKGYKKLK